MLKKKIKKKLKSNGKKNISQPSSINLTILGIDLG